jgi:hypothetical protein
LNYVPLTPTSIHQPDFSHKPLLAEQPYGSQTISRRILFPTDSFDNPPVQLISALTCY